MMMFGVLKPDSLGNTLLALMLAIGIALMGYFAIVALFSGIIFAGYLIATYPSQIAMFAIGFVVHHAYSEVKSA